MPLSVSAAGRKVVTGILSLYGAIAIVSAAIADGEQARPAVPRTLVFAGSADYPPFQWRDEDGGARGFIVDLERAMAGHGGRQVEHRLMEWRLALRAVESGEADAVALFASEERRRRFDFTEPFYYVAHAIFSRADGERYGRLEALNGRTVAVVAGAYAEQRLEALGGDIRLIRTPNERACLEVVAAGDAAACVEAAHSARHNAVAADLNVRQTSAPFWPRPYVFGVRKGNTELRDWLNGQMAMIQISGVYYQIYNNWLSELEWQEQTVGDMLRKLSWLVLPLVLIAGAGYLWSWSLRRRVKQQTHHLAVELDRGKRLQNELQYRMSHDTLTGLPNRTAFVEAMQHLIDARPGWRPTLMVLRIVNREQLITTFSYDIIQDLMAAFARRLQELDFERVGHFGSGLFAVIPRVPMGGDDLIRRINDPLELAALDIDPQIVVGVVAGAETGGNPGIVDELIRRAITAMSAARQKRLPWLTYSEALEPDPDDLMLLQDFHRHGTRDMLLHYQPKVDLKTGHVRAAEALIRWRHPSLGMLPPDRFIPLLERSGLIHRVTHWVAEETAAMVTRQALDGSDYSISINIAPYDLAEADLVAFITGIAARMNRHGLMLEITETGFIADPLHAREVLTELSEAGVRCAVDDFGTGYSSLSYLSEFPVNEVKLDRRFVVDMLTNPYHQVIVRSTITLAHELDMTVTAEGVEDARTLQALARMDCDAVQGYVVSPPVPEEEMRALFGLHVNRIGGQSLLEPT